MRPTFIALACLLLLAGCRREDPANKPNTPVATNKEAPTAENPPAEEPKTGTEPNATPPTGTEKPANKDEREKPLKPHGPPPVPDKKVPTKIVTPSPKDKDWGASSMTASGFAAKLGKSVSSLRQTVAQARTVVTTPEGEGRYQSDIQIVDPLTYSIAFVAIAEKPTSGVLVANGKQRMMRVGTAWSKPMPVTTALPSKPSETVAMMKNSDVTADLAPATVDGVRATEAWKNQFTRLLFQKTTEGKDAIGPAIENLKKLGYKVSVEERTSDFEGRQYHNYRLLATGKAGDATEIVVDDKRFLPITIRSTWKDAKGKSYGVLWMCSWKKDKPDPSKFEAPFPG